jgi:hypothetical protein
LQQLGSSSYQLRRLQTWRRHKLRSYLCRPALPCRTLWSG